MALPRFSFSGGATEFFQPNQALFRTTFTPSDKLRSDTYQAEAKAYQDAVEKYNEAIKLNPEVAPAIPTPISFTQADFDQFGVDASRRAQQLQNAKQNAFTAITNPEGFSQHYGIGSLGFEEGGAVGQDVGSLADPSRVDLGDGAPTFGIGDYKITPDVFVEYGSGSTNIPENVEGERVFLTENWKQGYGNLGFNVETPGNHRFGANASGSYFTGSQVFPETLQELGAPAEVKYGRGFSPEQYGAYYQTPAGTRITGRYLEETPDRGQEFEVMLSKQFGTTDLVNRIAHFLEKNRP